MCQKTTFSYANHHPSLAFFQAGIGKHNGSYQGTQLFVCPAGHGSFAKALKRCNGRIFGGWWWGFHVARWRRWSWVYPCSTALRCWGLLDPFATDVRFCCSKKKKDLCRGKGGNLTKKEKNDMVSLKYSEIFRWKAQVSRSKGLVQDLHMLVRPINICLYIHHFSIRIINTVAISALWVMFEKNL